MSESIKDELLRRAISVLKDRGTDRTTRDPSDLTWREFATSAIQITRYNSEDSIRYNDGIFRVGVDRSNKWAPITVDAIRIKHNFSQVLNFNYDYAVEALEVLRGLMVLDDLADV